VPNAVPGPAYQMMPIHSPQVPNFRHSMPPRKKRSSRTTKSPPVAPSPYCKYLVASSLYHVGYNSYLRINI
jgi:hypothetical protein